LKYIFLKVPELAKENVFALHGGTAINLFIRNMPRLSVDIDLTYIPVEERKQSINKINSTLGEIKNRLERIIPDVRIEHKKEIGKLLISSRGIKVKLEVNLVGRGVLSDIQKLSLCERAENEYDAFIVMPVVPFGQIYGGKICAALDRQHPRDLFDIKYLLENEGTSRDVLTGFILSLVSNDRPMYEVLKPNLLDQRLAMTNQFSGMSSEIFTYDEFEKTREEIILLINNQLTPRDRQFLLSVKNLTPDWSVYDFEKFPAVQWKLLNLEKLKSINPKKSKQQYEQLQNHLEIEC